MVTGVLTVWTFSSLERISFALSQSCVTESSGSGLQFNNDLMAASNDSL
jgi:hypothetical protein